MVASVRPKVASEASFSHGSLSSHSENPWHEKRLFKSVATSHRFLHMATESAGSFLRRY